MLFRIGAVALVLSGLVPQTTALVLPNSYAAKSPVTRGTTQLGAATGLTPKEEVKEIDYGEKSRLYRRTVFTHDDWVRHRSSDRFWKNLRAMTSSGVYKSLAKEVLATTSIAVVVCAFNAFVGGYTDFEGIKHDPVIQSQLAGLPLIPFTLSSPSLGLLLVFRTNTSYQRWDEARKNWGMNINHTRDLNRMGVAFYDSSASTPELRKKHLETLSLTTWAFVRSMKRHLSPEWEDEEAFRQELYERLPEKQALAIINAAHRPNRALFDLSLAVENLPMHFMRKNEMHRAVTIFEDNLGSSERLLTSPVPLFYSRHTARFVSFWLLLLPFALWEPFSGSWNHVSMIPATAMISIFMFGIEELATQLEEPFTILPMQAFCDKIYNWCTEITSWEPGDNGMEVYEPTAQQMGVYFEPPPSPAPAAVPIPAVSQSSLESELKFEPKPNGNLSEEELEADGSPRSGIRGFFGRKGQ